MRIRLRFRTKILLALVGTVILLVGTSLWAVRHQTASQVTQLVDRTMDRAERALAEVESLRNETLEPLANRFVFGIRFQAAMDAALEENDPMVLVDAARYEMELTALERGIASFTDMEGRVLATLLDGELVEEDAAAAPDPLVRAVLEEGETRVVGYRLFEGRLYSVQSYLLDFFGQPLGTLTLGFPVDDEVAGRLGQVVGVEVCFVAGDRCVAGTPDIAAAPEEGPGAGTGGAPPDADDDPDLRRRMVEAAREEEAVTVQWRDGRWALVAAPLPGAEAADVRQVLAVPLDEVLLPFDRIREAERLAGAAALVLALLLGFGLSRGLAGPVRTLVAATDRVREGEYDFEVEVSSGDEMEELAGAFNEMLGDLALKERYRGVLDKVVSRDVAEELLRGEIRLGGETREVTTLFADVRGFTSLSEGMTSQEIITMLNEWFDRAAGMVEAEGGVVDKFLGDGLMAIFGAPIAQEDHALRAVRAALAMRDGLDELNREREARDLAPIQVGFGVASGSVVAGNTGARDRLNYTVLGESVNLAARLCGEAGPSRILVSEATRRAAVSAGWELDAVQEESRSVKGVSRPIRPWRVEGLGSAAAGLLLPLLLLSGLLVGSPRSGHAQGFPLDPPTLAELGVGYVSPSGFFQIHPSGQLDVEGFFPGEAAPWLISETDPFASGRLRVFLDAFLGERLYATAEFRADRGQEPGSEDVTARVQQAFARVALWEPLALQLQAGQFTTPFGNHPGRRRSDADPFIRPPLNYEHRTVMSTFRVPGAVDGFLDWKNEPETSRPIGAPVVWGTPYPTGVMLLGAWEDLDFRLALVNSAPAAEPDQWGPGAPFGSVLVARVGYQPLPELHLGASYADGPYVREGVEDPLAEPGAPEDRTQFRTYSQKLLGLETTFTRGMTELRGEVILDRWRLPNVEESAVDVSGFLEGKARLAPGLFAALRYSTVRFNELTRSDGTTERWDHPVQRWQVAAGYRLARNLEVRGEYLLNRSSDAPELDTDLVSAQFWWRF